MLYVNLMCAVVCMLFLVVCSLFLFTKKRLKMLTNKMYEISLITCMGYIFVSILALLFGNNFLLTKVSVLLELMSFATLFAYLNTNLDVNNNTVDNLSNAYIHWIPLGIYLITAFFPTVKNIDSILFIAKSCTFVFYYAILIRKLFINKKRVSEHLNLTWIVLSISCINILGIGIPAYLNSTVSLWCVSQSLSLFMCFLALQNPDLHYDRLTKTFNYAAFNAVTNELLARQKQFVTIGVTFEDFKLMNNLYGSEVCDDLLYSLSMYLQYGLKNVLVFRVRASQFVLVIHTSKLSNILKKQDVRTSLKQGADAVMQKISLRSAQPWKSKVSSTDMIFRINVCALFCPDVGNSNQTVQALLNYGSRDKKDNFLWLNVDDRERINRLAYIEAALKDCAELNNIIVYYQPIYNTATKQFTSAEALARMKDGSESTSRIMGPGEFIDIAEKSGLIVPLGMQVLRQVCKFIKTHNMEELGVNYIEVNVSPVQCAQPNLAKDIIACLKEFNIDPKYINLEITETATIATDIMLNNLRELRKNNITFSLDDFGTGCSNMESILKPQHDRLFEFVKLDKLFIDSYFANKNTVLDLLVPLLKNEQFKLIAEGVEQEHQLIRLEELGVEYIQGFYFSRPVCEEEYLKFLQEHSVKQLENT